MATKKGKEKRDEESHDIHIPTHTHTHTHALELVQFNFPLQPSSTPVQNIFILTFSLPVTHKKLLFTLFLSPDVNCPSKINELSLSPLRSPSFHSISL